MELAEKFHSYEEEEWIPFNHTKDTLDKLSELNITLAVLSNHGHHPMIEKVLKKHELAKYFKVIVTSAQFDKRKPDPEIFFYILKNMDIEIPSSCLICGDEHADVVGGYKVGLQTILCERGYKFPFEQEIHVPELIQVKNISEIFPYIK